MLRYSMISLLSLLPSCQATMEGSASEDDDDAAFQLKSYEVPAGYESRVEDVLNRVFWRGDNVPLLGRAHQGAPGSVIVAAPALVLWRSPHCTSRPSQNGWPRSRPIHGCSWNWPRPRG